MATKTSKTIQEQNIEKQMSGCISGFFNHLLSPKRPSPKRLPPPVANSSDDKSKLPPPPPPQQLQPEIQLLMPDKETTTTTPIPTPVSPWKFAPRLSLDSRAVTDEKGGLRPKEIRIKSTCNSGEDYESRSPSVIARLMGLEPLSISTGSEHEPVEKVVLRRSASESRSRDYRFDDGPCFSNSVTVSNRINNRNESVPARKVDYSNNNVTRSNKNNTKSRNNSNNNNNQRRLMLERRSYYDTTDFFPPEVFAKQQSQPVTIYGEIERRLRARGIDEPKKDLETLKHILEAMQLKGLLHSSSSTKSTHNVVYDRRDESPIVLMKSARPTSPTNRRRNYNVSNCELSVSPRKERPARSVVKPPGRVENRSSSPTLRRKGGPLSVETTTARSSRSPVQSPRLTRPSPDQTVSRSPRRRRPTVDNFPGDDVSTVSDSSFSTSSYPDSERWRVEEQRDGRNLLERCDKLLNSIAEITASSSSNSNSSELQQPSPVSVLDSSFYKEDESSPSPVKKRIINFKDEAVIELEDELWSPTSSTQLLMHDNDTNLSDDTEFNYVSEVIRASNYFPGDKNLFLLIEKQSSFRGISRDNSKASILQRKLIFDTISEILDRNRNRPPWKAVSISERGSMLDRVWSEFQKIRECSQSEDLFEVVCGVLKKDMIQDPTTGWDDCPVEMSEAILDIERLIFKDLIGEAIRDLAAFGVRGHASCRKLVF